MQHSMNMLVERKLLTVTGSNPRGSYISAMLRSENRAMSRYASRNNLIEPYQKKKASIFFFRVCNLDLHLAATYAKGKASISVKWSDKLNKNELAFVKTSVVSYPAFKKFTE